MEPATVERLGEHIAVYVTREHRFGTDAFLLSDFARARAKEVACDLCSGCGIVAALWYRTPQAGPRRAYCVEIQPEAARLMALARERGDWPDPLVPLCGDLRGELPIPPGSCDVVTCNPPYNAANTGIPSAAAPALAARHETLCTLEDVCRAAARLLRFGGRLCLCQRPERLTDAMESMRRNGVEPKRLRFVQKRPDTPPWLFLLEGKRGSRPFLQVEAPFIVCAPDGGRSPQLRRVYRIEEETEGRGKCGS